MQRGGLSLCREGLDQRQHAGADEKGPPEGGHYVCGPHPKSSIVPVLWPNVFRSPPKRLATVSQMLPICVSFASTTCRLPRPSTPPTASIGSGSVACTFELAMPLP